MENYNIMVKNEMLKSVANKVEGISQKDIDAVLSAYVDLVIETLTKNRDEKITLPGVGAFSAKHVGERSGVAALAGGKAWTKPAHDEIQFKITKSIRELV